MSQHRYEENEELVKLVWDCNRKLLSTKEALAELKEKGFPMNEKKYYRIKKPVEKKTIGSKIKTIFKKIK